MYCSKCGSAMNEGTVRCPTCGSVADTGAKKDYFSYDYITVNANSKSAPEVVDCYEALGWEVSCRNGTFGFTTAINFKRNRKVRNKDQLNRLQVRLDDAINGIDVMEGEKTKGATIAAIVIGIIGALLFGGGMCLCMFTPFSALASYIVGCVLGLVGMGVCGIGYLAFKRISKKKTSEMNILIDKKRDEISVICEEAQKIMAVG